MLFRWFLLCLLHQSQVGDVVLSLQSLLQELNPLVILDGFPLKGVLLEVLQLVVDEDQSLALSLIQLQIMYPCESLLLVRQRKGLLHSLKAIQKIGIIASLSLGKILIEGREKKKE